nr:hypothetical protein [Tanacetum cinerariifolium]
MTRKKGVGVDDDLKRSYKEVLESLFTRRIIEFSSPSHRMPTNQRVYDDSTDPTTTSLASWGCQSRGMGNVERWTEEMGYIQGVPEVMQISAFMSNSKCPELARRFADQGGGPPRGEGYNAHNRRDHYLPYVPPRQIGRRTENANTEARWEEDWMSAPITFLSISSDDVSDKPVIVEAEIEGYLARLSRTHTELVGFSREQLWPMGKIELEVVFGNEGLSRKTMMKFTVVEASSLYNIILGRTGMRELRVVSSTIHAMMKFPTPRGIATLVPRRDAIFKCRQIEVRHASLEEPSEEKTREKKEEGSTEDRRVRLVTTEHGGHSKTDQPACPECKSKHYPGSIKLEDVGPRKKQSIDEGSEGMAQSEDSKAGTIPHMDIKPGPSKKEKKKRRRRGEDGVLHRSRHLRLHRNAIWPKNVGATYQRLVDSAFQTQLGRNLKAYVDDMVIKSRTKIDMMETFDNLKKINMQLNSKKCSFGVNLSGKLAALNRFLSRSAERAMPFFDTLKNITKENMDDFRWMEAAKQAFQGLKILIMELPTLTTLNLKETLYVYLATSREAVSGVLMADRKGKQNTNPRLRRYFEAHLIKLITDQPIKQILNKPEASRKLAKYAVELGAYNIAYMPRNAIKGQVLADFLNEVPVGTGNVEVWARLVLINPTGTEYTYTIRLNFASTNNEAEYEALLAGLRIPGKMKVPALKVKTSNGETPFSLTYGSEAVIPVEIGMPTYRTIQWNEALNEEKMRLNLDLIQERREKVAIREEKYNKKMEHY